MRCPQCRHRADARRWWRLPEELTCYHCAARLARSSRLGFGESLLTWLLVMLPGTVIAWFGGMTGFVLGGILALLILPVRPWNGLRYELADSEAIGLPVAVAQPRLVGPVRTENPSEPASVGRPLPPASES